MHEIIRLNNEIIRLQNDVTYIKGEFVQLYKEVNALKDQQAQLIQVLSKAIIQLREQIDTKKDK